MGSGEAREEAETLAGLEPGFQGRRVGRKGEGGGERRGSGEERPGLGP